MKKEIRYISATLLSLFTLGFLVTPVTLAAECDNDGDGFVVISNAVMKQVAPGTAYNENGNYSPAQWQNFYDQYNKGLDKLTEDEKCQALNFKKGAEPSRCDAIALNANSNVYDPAKVATPPSGSQVNPAALDTLDNGIDEDCNGKDATLVDSTGTGSTDVGGLVQKVITLLGRLVAAVSVIIMIWGGVLYATAAGDESKTSKARKAIIGAVIGLIVGLLAPTIVNLIVANLK